MKKLATGLGIGVITVGIILALNWDRVERFQFVGSLFSGVEQDEQFNRMTELFPFKTLQPSSTPYEFPEGEKISLPEKFNDYFGNEVTTQDFLTETDTAALLVLHKGEVRYESYWLTGGRDVQWLSMSVAKSFTSALVGIAVDEGYIKSIEDPIDQYVPALKGSVYEGTRIKDILQMSSGVAWNENYADPDSDVIRFGKVMALGGSLASFAKDMTRDHEPGTYNRYNSMDTQTLAYLLIAATGRSLTDYMEEKLWQPMGPESKAYWLTDDDGTELGMFGFNATARDYAKIGELYRNKGNWQGKQLISPEWVQASVTPDAPHLVPGENPASDFPMGYGYQWWLMDGPDHDYSAIGVYNQFIYVNPTTDTVIVKLSANNTYGMTEDISSYREFETVEFFRAIARGL